MIIKLLLRRAEASMGGVGASEEEEESHLLKEKRSSSLKTETYSKIWQRRSVWIRHSALHSFEIRNVEFWSGWRQQRPSSADAAVSEEKNSKESPASTGVVDKTAVRRRNFPQLVSFIRSLPLIYSTHLVMNRPNNQI